MAARKITRMYNLIPFKPRILLKDITYKDFSRFQSTQTSNHVAARPSSIEIASDDHLAALHPFTRVNELHKDYLERLIPPAKASFNLAAYVNTSKTLQEFIKLGVSLYDVENTNRTAARHFLTLDFERDCAKYLQFLVDNGLEEKNLGKFISEYPNIFSQFLDDLQVKINYLESKGFSKKQIASVLNKYSRIISFKTKTLDFKLGQLQIEFKLTGDMIRKIVCKYPNIVAIPATQYKLVYFTITEEFGFKIDELQKILINQPELTEILRPHLIDRLDLIHNTIGLSHETIVRFPELITGPKLEIEHRFNYLKQLNRHQFDPKKPLYVPPSALCKLSDKDFCKKYAKTSLEDYKLFVKSC